MKRQYNWVPDKYDSRDHLFASHADIGALPQSVDLRPHCPPIQDQGQLGSCTGNALCGAMDYIHPSAVFSRLFVYYNERVIEHDVRQDGGAQIRDGVKSLSKLGVCLESEWPYVESAFAHKPSAKCFADALKAKITAYQRVSGLTGMLQCLADGLPFVFGFTVYDAFESEEVAKTGVLNLPLPSESIVGGHAVLCVGYDTLSRRFIVRNSWGTSWGQAGYFTIPFEYLTNTKLASDMWVLRK